MPGEVEAKVATGQGHSPINLSLDLLISERNRPLQRIAAGWQELGDKRAVLLVQVAPSQQRDEGRLAYFSICCRCRYTPRWSSGTRAGTTTMSSTSWNAMAWRTA
jgi:hypothetical protein